MPWVRLDDAFPQHPKVVVVGPLGIAMQVAGLCYCSRFLTDGFIPTSAVPTMMDFSELDEHAFNGGGNVCWRAVRKLTEAGIWLEVDGGYQIHDYLLYQPSKAQVLKEREANRLRQERFRDKPSNAVTNGDVTVGITRQSRVNNSAPVPVPNPVPKEESTSSTSTREAKSEFLSAMVTGYAANGFGQITEVLASKVIDFEDQWLAKWRAPPDTAIARYALTEAAGNEKRSWTYVEAILKRILAAGKVEPLARSNGNGAHQRDDAEVHAKPARRSPFGIDESIPARSKYGGVVIGKGPVS